MSRIGKRTLTIPENVNVEFKEHKLTVKGPKGELSLDIIPELDLEINEKEITVKCLNNIKHTNEMQGTTNANIKNMIIGVTEGYTKELETIGVGYRFALKGKELDVQAGYSHHVMVEIPEGITVEVPSNTEVVIKGIDKCKVGEFAANVRKIRQPEPYKGKGIRYKNEVVRRKEGKKASK